ncbi:MAG: GRP family sugar transporter [Candidatus Daviesbacteria bacterium]|nr:GRP family sugar transporter [Candidatus Daviesbacteria bacterium]
MANLGFLAALGAALAWGTWMVPFKKSGSSNLIQSQALIAVAIGFSGLIISLLLGFPLNFNIYGLISGVLWAIGCAISLTALVNLGLSIATPLLSSLVVLSSFLWGALVFHELPGGLMLGFLGMGLIVAGVIIVSSTGNMTSRNAKKGLLAGVIAGLIFGSQLVPIKIGHVSTADFFFSVCLGIFITGLLIAFIMRVKFERKAIGSSLFCGVIWNLGNLLSLVAVSLIGLTKAGPVSQVAALVAVLWGVFYFKEITKRRQKIQVLIGAAVLVGGVIVLGFS